jgi:hypothetical protein
LVKQDLDVGIILKRIWKVYETRGRLLWTR